MSRSEGPTPMENLEQWISEVLDAMETTAKDDAAKLRGWLRYAIAVIVKKNASRNIIDAEELADEWIRIGRRMMNQSKDSRLYTLQTFAEAMTKLYESMEVEAEQLMKEEPDA